MTIIQTALHFLIHYMQETFCHIPQHPQNTHSRMLINNTFSSNTEDNLISGNVISFISDHYAQFLFMKNMKIKQKETTDIYSHGLINLNEAVFET